MIPLIVMAVLGTLYVVWPAPKLDTPPPAQTSVGTEHFSRSVAVTSFTASATVGESTSTKK